MTLVYRRGDTTAPSGEGQKLLVHLCNDAGKWGKGFVLAVSKRWSEPERVYRAAGELQLGAVQFVRVTDEITVANLIGQHGIAYRGRPDAPIRYDALRLGLQRVAEQAQLEGASVHMPRLGAGLAGGTWPAVEAIVRDTLCAAGVEVTVYDLG